MTERKTRHGTLTTQLGDLRTTPDMADMARNKARELNVSVMELCRIALAKFLGIKPPKIENGRPRKETK